MYDELVKRLRELHPEEFGDAWDFAFACQQAMHEAADAIEELQKAVNFHKPITNADRIRAMTDEELADLYMKAIEDEEYPGWWGNRMGLLAWLKQEAVSDG